MTTEKTISRVSRRLSAMTMTAVAALMAFTPSCNGPVEELGAKTARIALAFIPNAGQTDADIRFQARAFGGMAFFTNSGVTLSLPKSPTTTPSQDPIEEQRIAGFKHVARRVDRFATVRVNYVGASKDTLVHEGTKLAGVANFLIGEDSSQWKTNLPTYSGIVYDEAYPGIRIRYDGANDALKSTVDVAPGADPSLVRWTYDGAQSVRIDEATGDLVLVIGTAEQDGVKGEDTLIEHAPVAWQWKGDKKVPVPVRFHLEAGGLISYDLGAFDRSSALVIDPSISYSTFFGSKTVSTERAMAVGIDNTVYVTGDTTALTYPVTSGVKGPAHKGGWDVFVTKLNADGASLAYSTFFGGAGDDSAYDIAVDNGGNAWIVGATTGTVPLKFPVQANRSGAVEGFVAKLNASGSDFVFSSYHGGNADDFMYGVALDSAGNGYVTGKTTSTNFPVTGGTLLPSGMMDAFFTKWSPAGARSYSTYLGGTADDVGRAIAVNAAGDAIYITGETSSTNFGPVMSMPGADWSANGGVDGFLVAFSGATPVLARGTYIGAGQEDVARNVTIDSGGNVNVVGDTTSTGFPANYTLGSAGGRDVFVNRYNSTLTSSVFSYRVAGSQDDYGRGIAVDTSGAVWLTGSTASPAFAGYTTGYVSPGLMGTDIYLTKIVPGGLAGATVGRNARFGGSGTDDASDVLLDATGIYVAGTTTSANYPTGPNAVFRATGSSGTDVVVTKLDINGFGRVWSTYVTGDTTEEGNAIAVQGSYAYVVGRTNSSGFVTSPGVDDTSYNMGTYDAFILKASTTSNELVYSTFIGGNGNDEAAGVAVDSGGNAVIVGQTTSTNFPEANRPANVGSLNIAGNVIPDAFFVRLNSTGTALASSFRFGGDQVDVATDVALDNAGKAYVTGYTRSFPLTFPLQSPLQPMISSVDAFVAKLDLTTMPPTWVYNTYLGGTQSDVAWGIATDGNGNAFVTGQTASADFAAGQVAKQLQPAYGGAMDAFLTKINATGTKVEYNTYWGGSGQDIGRDVVVDNMGNAYVVGDTSSADMLERPLFGGLDTWYDRGFPVISGLLSGLSDGFVVSVDPTGEVGRYATYFGGTGNDSLYGVAVCPGTQQIAFTGQTSSNDMLLAGGATPQGSVQHGGLDALVGRVDDYSGYWDFSFTSYLGGSADDAGRDVAIIPSGCQPVLTGYTKSSNFTATGNAYDSSYNSDTDIFVTRFSP